MLPVNPQLTGESSDLLRLLREIAKEVNARLILSGDTMTGELTLATNTVTVAPLHFVTGPLKTSPVAGDLEYSAGHLYLTDGARHAFTTSSGVKITTTTVANTVADTTLYSYAFSANELHDDERIIFDIAGVYSNASAADDFTIYVKLNGTAIHTITRVGGNQTNAGWQLSFEMTTRTVGASGTFVHFAKFSDNDKVYVQSDATEHAVDTTTTNTIAITIVWAAAKVGNTFSCTQGSLICHN